VMVGVRCPFDPASISPTRNRIARVDILSFDGFLENNK
jgi:hypothetical protein